MAVFLEKIEGVSKWPAKSVLLKFLKSDQFTPWTTKYFPKEIEDLVDKSAAIKAMKWVQVFNSFRGMTVDNEDSFLVDDNSVSMRQEEIRTVLFQEKWKAKALILQGPEGSGKYCAIKCLAQSGNMRPYECTNETRRMDYFRDHY